MSRQGMYTLMGACALVIVLANWRIVQVLNPEPPPPQVTPGGVGQPHPVTPVQVVQPPEVLPSLPTTEVGDPRRYATQVLVGTWQLDPAATRGANGELSPKEQRRLGHEMEAYQRAMASYLEGGALEFLDVRTAEVLSKVRWEFNELRNDDVVVAYEYEDQTRANQRVMVPSYDTLATQRDDFVFVWHRMPTRPARSANVDPPPVRHNPEPPRSSARPARATRMPSARGNSTYAWEKAAAAQRRWKEYKQRSEVSQRVFAACREARTCASACGTNATCVQACGTRHGCSVEPALYVR